MKKLIFAILVIAFASCTDDVYYRQSVIVDTLGDAKLETVVLNDIYGRHSLFDSYETVWFKRDDLNDVSDSLIEKRLFQADSVVQFIKRINEKTK